ncbi:MAG: DNA-3-methyladenine glycosylase [Thermoplasmatales archaeon B_DKE]|nr:MAG: DNA-3-methyladenine glycosylase [Thermoplasmatales archaeon B_DKE]
MEHRVRCDWVPENDSLYVRYHDEEWGVPLHDDRSLFEFLILEGAQAGLSWKTVLHKREKFRKAYNNFDPVKIAEYDEIKVASLVSDKGIIRNRLKINSAIHNARAFLTVKEEYGSFDSYIWKFTENTQITNNWQSIKQIPTRTTEAEKMSSDLSSRGFKFVGPTICYSFMEATGMVNDHLRSCFRHEEISGLSGRRTDLSL